MDLKTTIIFAAIAALMIILVFRIGFRYGIYKSYMAFIKNNTNGIFRVDTTNPDKDVFSLEITCPIGELPEKDYIVFKVENDSSQEKPVA